MDDFLVKPVQQKKLIETLQEYMQAQQPSVKVA